MNRKFEAVPAIRQAVPLLIGLVGASSSGKTYSALRLAQGIQKLNPGKIVVIDTESKRSLHYADKFSFEFVEFKEPFGSLDYISALEYAESLNPSVIVVDSCSHEKEGPGGMLDFHEKELDRLAGNDLSKRDRVSMLAWSKPKQDHRALINKILRINANMIFCFRSKEISKPVKDKKTGKNIIQEQGFIPVASDDFIYEMTINFLLMPKSDGHPEWKSDKPGEKMAMKLPEQFKYIFENKDVQLDEEIGFKLAKWSAGNKEESQQPKQQPTPQTASEPEQKTDRDIALDVLKFYDKEKLIHSDFIKQSDLSIAWLIDNQRAHEKNGFGKIRSLIFQIEERMEESMKKEHNLYQKDLI